MNATIRWNPTLPSIGRWCPRVEVPLEGTYSDKLSEYLLKRRGIPDMFTCRVPVEFFHSEGLQPQRARYLAQIDRHLQAKYLISSLWPRMSTHFVDKVHALCNAGKLNQIKQWFHTANGCILPMLLSHENPDLIYDRIDRMTKFCLENCANNYAVFISRLKKTRKLIRKGWATDSFTEAFKVRDCVPYLKEFLSGLPTSGPSDAGTYVLIWTQTRSTGLADSVMIRNSIDKCIKTLTRVPRTITLDHETVNSVLGPEFAQAIRGTAAHVSAGPKACFQVTQEEGGQTGLIKILTKRKVLYRSYNFEDLSFITHEARPVRSAQDLTSWAIQEAHERPIHVRCVRVHAVAEPSKARTITVAHFAYQVILGIAARILQPALKCQHVEGGLHASRNLWRFLYRDLSPQDTLWQELSGQGPNYGVSSDLEEATDYGNPSVARQILHAAYIQCMTIPGFPMGLMVLAKTLFLSKRAILYMCGGWKLAIKRSGWLMGDRLTKFILTTAHDYALHRSRIEVGAVVGDDCIGITKDPKRGQDYFQALEDIDFKISRDDQFISTKLLFYCEEGALVPNKTPELPAVEVRRKTGNTYLDYPRIRLMIPSVIETDSYSMTNVGRFSLLGKESRWVAQNTPSKIPLFTRAVLLQHLLVPQDPDTLCPFIPVELGGDGAYIEDPQFLGKVIQGKSRSPKEVAFRISQMQNGKWAPRFVRSERLNEVQHKHHIIVPKVQGMEAMLPPDSIIKVDRSKMSILTSLKTHYLESPEITMFRIFRSAYYKDLLRGREPPTIKFDVDRSFLGGNEDPVINLPNFLQQWKEEGVLTKNSYNYMVIRDHVKTLDYMSLGWEFRLGDTHRNLNYRFGEWLHSHSLFNETITEVIRCLRDSEELPRVARDRLSLFMETDSYLISEVERWETFPSIIILISGDKKLAARIVRVARAKSNKPVAVVLMHPALFMIGRLEEMEETMSSFLLGPLDNVVLEDEGAKEFADFTMFDEGQGPDWIFEGSFFGRPTQYVGVYETYVADSGITEPEPIPEEESGVTELEELPLNDETFAIEIEPSPFVQWSIKNSKILSRPAFKRWWSLNISMSDSTYYRDARQLEESRGFFCRGLRVPDYCFQ